MRIISQNGMIDVPYEMTAFRNSEGMILMNMAGETGRGSVMARYSSTEKADKAMGECRRCYSCFNAKVFQFPADEEI